MDKILAEKKGLGFSMIIRISIISMIIAAISAIASWYYAIKSKEHANQSLAIMKEQYALNRSQVKNQYIDEACVAFEKKSTPFHYINSLSVNLEEKEEIWKQCCIRHKGRIPKKTFFQQKMEMEGTERK